MPDYTMESGDTLSALALKNKTDVPTLMGLNPSIADPNSIYAGQTLQLPGASPTLVEKAKLTPRQQLLNTLAGDEGFRTNAYADPVKGTSVPTTGYGTTRNSPGAIEYLTSQGLDPNKVFTIANSKYFIGI